jgi:hypothetical protein
MYMKRVQIKTEYHQLLEMAPASGVRGLGTAFVVILDSTDFQTKDAAGSLSAHCRNLEVDYQSGSKPPHSKGSADLRTGFNASIGPQPSIWGIWESQSLCPLRSEEIGELAFSADELLGIKRSFKYEEAVVGKDGQRCGNLGQGLPIARDERFRST